MKRTATAAIAAATALSLAVVPAYAEDAKDPGKDDTNASSQDNQGSSSKAVSYTHLTLPTTPYV